MKRIKLVALFSGLMFGSFLLGKASGTKATIPTDDLIKRSGIVAVGEITSNRLILPTKRNEDGSWVQEKYRVGAKISEFLKCSLDEVEFDVGPLSLVPGQKFILYLNGKTIEIDDEFGKRKALVFDFLGPPAKCVEATPENIEENRKIIQSH